MVGFAIYPRLPEDDLRKMAKEAIEKITEWFQNNPERDDCNAELWYGKQLCVKRSSIAAQINALLEECIVEDAEARTTSLNELSTLVENPQELLDRLAPETDDGQEQTAE